MHKVSCASCGSRHCMRVWRLGTTHTRFRGGRFGACSNRLPVVAAVFLLSVVDLFFAFAGFG